MGAEYSTDWGISLPISNNELKLIDGFIIQLFSISLPISNNELKPNGKRLASHICISLPISNNELKPLKQTFQ